MSLQELKNSLTELLQDYSDNNIISDSDIIDFENLIIDYDNENDSDYYSDFLTNLNIYCFDDIKNNLIKDIDNVQDLINLTDEVEYTEADNYKIDIYNSLSNVYKSDLIDWVNDYLL